jgi:hypothetical protein
LIQALMPLNSGAGKVVQAAEITTEITMKASEANASLGFDASLDFDERTLVTKVPCHRRQR